MANSTNTMILGTCLQLCPEKERKLRVKNKLIHPIEKKLGKDAGKDYILIKSFSRSAAGNTSCCDPKQIRPPYICRRTTNYTVENVWLYGSAQLLSGSLRNDSFSSSNSLCDSCSSGTEDVWNMSAGLERG